MCQPKCNCVDNHSLVDNADDTTTALYSILMEYELMNSIKLIPIGCLQKVFCVFHSREYGIIERALKVLFISRECITQKRQKTGWTEYEKEKNCWIIAIINGCLLSCNQIITPNRKNDNHQPTMTLNLIYHYYHILLHETQWID